MEKINFHIPGLNKLFPLNYLFINYMEQFPERFEDGVQYVAAQGDDVQNLATKGNGMQHITADGGNSDVHNTMANNCDAQNLTDKGEENNKKNNIQIGSVYGVFPPAVWNSGRVELGNTNLDYVKRVVGEMAKKNIPIRWTFTNPLVKEEHLSDKFCNFCLEVSHNERNGVIVVSEILENYIRQKYPKLGIISSTCKCIEDKDLLFSELEKDYKLVVLDYNFNTDTELLREIPQKDKVEILINAGCVPNCPYRKKHYAFHGEEQLSGKSKKWTDPCGYKNNPWEACEYKTFVSKERLYGELVPMGYSNFKIEGRMNFMMRALEYYVYYMVKDEFRDRVRFEIVSGLKNSGVVRFG